MSPRPAKTTFCVLLLLLIRTAAGQDESAVPSSPSSAVSIASWPQYRRDAGLTGFSPLSGGLTESPTVLWSVNLGGSVVRKEHAQLVDVNGDEHPELLRVLSDRLICQTVNGDRLWETRKFTQPKIVQIRDFAGDGTRGILISSNTGVAQHRHIISGTTGESAFLYTCENVFGRYERFGTILPDVPGEQLCVWWSGDSAGRFGADKARGVGYLWSFENGVESPTVRFQVEEEGTIYAPLHLFADMNGDGSRDMVMISHEAMWVYDLASRTRITHSVWGPQIRTYWAATGAVRLSEDELPSLLMINPMLPGVQVVTQDGTTARSRWKVIVGSREDQYQTAVKIAGAATDPFVDLDADGDIEILAAVTNEHNDDRPHLVIFSADDGTRLYDEADQCILTVDNLDGEGPPEVLIREGAHALRISNWQHGRFIDRWRSDQASPVLSEAPAEGHLERGVGARSSGRNMPLQRDPQDESRFLLQTGDTIQSVRLTADSFESVRIVNQPSEESQSPDYHWDGMRLLALQDSERRVTYEVPLESFYQPLPVLVGRLAGEQRIIVREHTGGLVSLATNGSDRRVLIEQSPPSSGVALTDINGDGTNEVLAPVTRSDGRVAVAAVDATGNQLFQVEGPPTATATELGPTGRHGPNQGRWFVVRHQVPYRNTQVDAFDGRTGQRLWTRDYLGPERVPATKFMLHLPTAVHDVNGDGADDLIASSENWYGVVSVADNRLLSPVSTITAAVPGHWGAYATPIVADIQGTQQPFVFHNNAYALTMLTDLNGSPIWHYGLTRDTTHAALSGLADLDGNGTMELVTIRKDGLLRAFDATAQDRRCPTCPPEGPLTDANHSGHVRWISQLPPPVSDLTSMDLNADGKTELLCGSGDGRLYALKEADGACEILWSVHLGATVGAPVVADLDADRVAEILVTTTDGRLHCLSSAKRTALAD